MSLNRHTASVWADDTLVDVGRGGGCTILGINVMPLNSTLPNG